MSLVSPQLLAFMAIAEHKTVHAAADVVHITQTAVTQRIKALEANLGVSLFTRTRRGMLLTSEGEALLRYCSAVKDLEGEALAQIKGAAIEAEVRLSIKGPTSIMHSRIIPQCFSVMKDFPNLIMHFAITDAENREQSLRSGAVQFTVIEQENVAKEMASKALAPEEYVLVCSHQWKNRPLKEIISQERIVDFNPQDQMTFNYLKHFDLYENVVTERHFANRPESLAKLIAEGFGYGVLTKELAQHYLDENQLTLLNEGKTYNNILYLAWYPRPEPPKYFSALIEQIS